MPINHVLRELVVISEQPEPALIAHRSRTTGGVDDVGEKHGREHTFQFSRPIFAMAGDKLLDILVQLLFVSPTQK